MHTLPMLGCVVQSNAGILQSNTVFNEWQETKNANASSNRSMEQNQQNELAIEELIHLEIQASVSAKFLKSVLEVLDACLSTKALHKNVHVLYALLHSTTSNAGKHDLLASFRDKTLVTDYEYNTKQEQETFGAWSIDLCRSTDPLTDVVGFMRNYLEEKSVSQHGGGWVDVETVMGVLQGGIRSYRTQRAAQMNEDGSNTIFENGNVNGTEDGEVGNRNDTENNNDASFVYEEADGASAFFLPYSWSLVLDATRELSWPIENVELFPPRPYFMEDTLPIEEEERRKWQNNQAVEVYVGSMALNTTYLDLQEAFGKHGTVLSARVVMDPRDPTKSRGFAFVKAATLAEATEMVTQLNGVELMGQNLKVNIVVNKKTTNGRSATRIDLELNAPL